jgi:hypothetical protein
LEKVGLYGKWRTLIGFLLILEARYPFMKKPKAGGSQIGRTSIWSWLALKGRPILKGGELPCRIPTLVLVNGKYVWRMSAKPGRIVARLIPGIGYVLIGIDGYMDIRDGKVPWVSDLVEGSFLMADITMRVTTPPPVYHIIVKRGAKGPVDYTLFDYEYYFWMKYLGVEPP